MRQVDDLNANVAALQQARIDTPAAASQNAGQKRADQSAPLSREQPPAALRTTTTARFTNANWKFAGQFPILINSRDVLRKFADADVHIDDIRRGKAQVPAIFLASLPSDLSTLQSVKTRKLVFIKSVLPLILKVNRTIARQRELLLYLRRAEAEGQVLSSFDRQFLTAMAERYRTKPGDWTELLRRVDIVPPSLALAQAAEESGWGTSRFARVGNAVYGQRTFRTGKGMVPLDRDTDGRYEVRRFETLYLSIEAYVRNLNTHPAYKTFRQARAALRHFDGKIDSVRLAGALESYSERRGAYADNIRSIIRGNRLQQFDRARLSDDEEIAMRPGRGERPS